MNVSVVVLNAVVVVVARNTLVAVVVRVAETVAVVVTRAVTTKNCGGSVSVVVAASAQLICGTLGYHDVTNLYFYMSNGFYNGLSTFALCASYCQKDSLCKAFRYSYWSDAGSQYCEFFDTPL